MDLIILATIIGFIALAVFLVLVAMGMFGPVDWSSNDSSPGFFVPTGKGGMIYIP